jgi:hypothetical protein
VTIARRLDAIETGLDPTARVLHWLAEAHAYDSFDAYVEAALTGHGEMPLDRLVCESSEAARARRASDEDARAEIRSTVVRYFIVLRISEVTAQALEREALLHAALTAYMLLAVERGARQDGEWLSVAHLRDLALARVGELHALRDARSLVEQRFLGGERALFPAAQRAWEAQFTQADRLARMTVRQGELDGAPGINGDAPLVAPGRTERCIDDLVEPARAKTLDLMGDGHGALTRMRAWLAPS